MNIIVSNEGRAGRMKKYVVFFLIIQIEVEDA